MLLLALSPAQCTRSAESGQASGAGILFDMVSHAKDAYPFAGRTLWGDYLLLESQILRRSASMHRS